MSQELMLIDERTPVELGVTKELIAGLKGRLTGLSGETTYGYEQVRAGIAEVRTIRTGVEKSRKALKQAALECCRKVDAEAKRVTGLLLEIEEPLRLEKERVDEAREAVRREREERIRREQEEREAEERAKREAEEQAKREAERKEREAEAARLAAEREKLAEERRKLEEERAAERKRMDEERRKVEAERAQIEAEKRKAEEAARKEREAKEAAERKKLEAERQKQTEIERKKIESARKPDVERLRDFADQLMAVTPPSGMRTDWGSEVLKSGLHQLNRTVQILRGM